MAVLRGQVQRPGPQVVNWIAASAVAQEHLHHLRVALQGGRVQRCHPVLVGQVGICAGLQQVAGHERLAPLGGELQRRGTVLALVLAGSRLHQKLNHLHVSAQRRHVNRRRAPLVGVALGLGLHQIPDHLQVPPLRRDVQRRGAQAPGDVLVIPSLHKQLHHLHLAVQRSHVQRHRPVAVRPRRVGLRLHQGPHHLQVPAQRRHVQGHRAVLVRQILVRSGVQQHLQDGQSPGLAGLVQRRLPSIIGAVWVLKLPQEGHRVVAAACGGSFQQLQVEVLHQLIQHHGHLFRTPQLLPRLAFLQKQLLPEVRHPGPLLDLALHKGTEIHRRARRILGALRGFQGQDALTTQADDVAHRSMRH
mmetsp:Transcript_94162/g.224139  ORF Transcript_94162/g.224139 Transcript_94162/m.224139 type:complete len:360 (+) Transcript_94162:95-1174(+)